jgi:hypothetical protein
MHGRPRTASGDDRDRGRDLGRKRLLGWLAVLVIAVASVGCSSGSDDDSATTSTTRSSPSTSTSSTTTTAPVATTTTVPADPLPLGTEVELNDGRGLVGTMTIVGVESSPVCPHAGNLVAEKGRFQVFDVRFHALGVDVAVTPLSFELRGPDGTVEPRDSNIEGICDMGADTEGRDDDGIVSGLGWEGPIAFDTGLTGGTVTYEDEPLGPFTWSF